MMFEEKKMFLRALKYSLFTELKTCIAMQLSWFVVSVLAVARRVSLNRTM